MGMILHLSDFHFGKNPTLEKSRLTSLAEWIINQQINIRYLIFTGDIIDARTITTKCIVEMINSFPEDYNDFVVENIDKEADSYISTIKSKGLKHIKKYNEFLKKNYMESLNKAEEIFISFIKKIQVDSERVIICCGNHDRIRFIYDDNTTFSCEKDKINETMYGQEFEPYNHFCSAVNNRLSYNTTVYKHDGINFVIANSNWRVPTNNESNNMCINCGHVAELLYEIKISQNFNRNKTIFIAHKPFDDICETTKFPYTKDQMITLYEMIEQTAVMFLYGDKHSYSVKLKNELKEFMCGVPLSHDNARYNLIDYDPCTGVKSCKYIYNSKEEWSMIPVADCTDKVYNLSKEHLKSLAFYVLNNTENSIIAPDWEKAISTIRDSISNENIKLISSLFSACSTINRGNEKIPFDNNNLFEYFCSMINNSQTHRPISIKGSPGTGKSTFITIQYLYMLFKVYCGTSKYIPFYFNLDKVISNNENFESNNINIEDIISKCHEVLKTFIKECLNIGKTHDLPICIFMDGFQKRNMLIYSNKTLETLVYETLEAEFKNGSNKYVMCFNTHDTKLFEPTLNQMNRFESVMFFNPVSVVSYKNKIERSDILISSYLKLKGNDETDINNFKCKLQKLHKTTIDLNFLHKNYELICSIDKNFDSWELMKKYVSSLSEVAEDLFGAKKLQSLQKLSYLLLHKGKTFQEIIDENSLADICFLDFVKLCDNPNIAEYLKASYFVQELKTYSHTNERIPKDSILYDFITRDLSIMIRLIMEIETESQRLLKSFVDKHSTELSGFLYSTIVYLVGHIKIRNKYELIEIIKSITASKENNFFDFCHERSKTLALIICEENNETADEFVCKLMNDEEYRKFNRLYQLHYYQDILDTLGDNQTVWDINNSLGTSFDFYNCFLVLVSKITFNLDMQKAYPLIAIDLFTICDFVYSRLQNVGTERSLFYSACYNKKNDSIYKNILLKTIFLISKYLENIEISQAHNNYINAYFKFIKNKFESIIDLIDKNADKDLSIPYVSSSYDFEEILKLHGMPRVGWNINNIGQIKIDNQPKYTMCDEKDSSDIDANSKCAVLHETVMQHIVETVYIAQMFLPEKSNLSEYSKSKIISLLLLSELGKTATGDYSPDYTNARSRYAPLEQSKLSNILMLGAVDGYSNNESYFHSLTKTDVSGNNLDYNMIICQEIKLIQMEYKYHCLYDILEFTAERRKEFEDDFVEPTTEITKEIRKKLIRSNPRFQEHFKHNLL